MALLVFDAYLATYLSIHSTLKAETNKIKHGEERHNIERFSPPHSWHLICHFIIIIIIITWNEHGDGWQLSLPCAKIYSNRYPLDAHSVSPDQRISIYLSLSLSISLLTRVSCLYSDQ